MAIFVILKMVATDAMKILLVEDNPINQRLAALIFSRLDLKFDLASNGKEAIELNRQKAYDLIFMDLLMPEMDGMEATRQIRNQEIDRGTQHCAIIVALSANEAFGKKEECLESGMDDFMEKPFQPYKLQNIIAKFFQDS